MFSRKNNPTYIGNGLLTDQQKYREGANEPVEMQPVSSRYNYVNLDNQGNSLLTADQYVTKQTKPSENYEMKTMNSNQEVMQQQFPRRQDYPSFDYGYLPDKSQMRAQPMGSQLPIYQSKIKANGQQNYESTMAQQKTQPQYKSQMPQYQQYPSSLQYHPPYQQYPQQPQQQQFQSQLPQYQSSIKSAWAQPQTQKLKKQQPPQQPQQSQPQLPQYQSTIQPQWTQPQTTFPSGYNYTTYQSTMPPKMTHGDLRPVQASFQSNISMNGLSFQSQMRQPGQMPNKEEKTSMPEMYVMCSFCGSPQNIPADSSVFICYNCQNRGECFPTHSIFKCGGCNKKVAYQLGTSNLIRCGKCKTVNEVAVTHQQALNRSMLNISKIDPKDVSVEEEKKVIKKTKQADEQPLLKDTSLQYPNMTINAEDEEQLEEIVDTIKKQDEEPLRKPSRNR